MCRIVLYFFLAGFCWSTCAQNRNDQLVTASFGDVSLSVILDSLSQQLPLFFSYNSDILPTSSRFTIEAIDQPIDQFLSRLLVGTGLTYSFYKDQVIFNYEEVEGKPTSRKKFFALSGVVVDSGGLPMANVNVFLDRTTIGTTTRHDGSYRIEKIPVGRYDVAFSFVGFETKSYHLFEENGGARIQHHQMQEAVQELEEVAIVAKRADGDQIEWLNSYTVFIKELVGTSANAKGCFVVNPEVLQFENKNGILRAFTSEPLVIVNNALGYKLNYLIESFSKDGPDIRYRGIVQFRNTDRQAIEKRQLKRNRKVSYRGSFRHFKKALLTNRLKQEGFRLYQVKSLEDVAEKSSQALTLQDILVFKGNHYELEFEDYLVVIYRKEDESEAFLEDPTARRIVMSGRESDPAVGPQVSAIKLLDGPVRLNMTGRIEERFGLTTYGYWAWERLADLVPINYDPSLDKL